MKKYLVYWSLFIVIFAALFAWWWMRPTNYIERLTTLSVPVESTLFSESTDSAKVYLYKAGSSDVKKIIEGCEFHGGTFASTDQTSAIALSGNAAFSALGLFKSDHIGCLIKGTKENDGWEFFVKDDLLYFQVNH